MPRAVLCKNVCMLLGVFSLAAISNAAKAGDERLEYKLVTIGVDTKVSPAPNIEGRILTSGKYFGVAFYKDGRIAVKDFVGEADLLKGIGTFRGYSTYTFQDGASLTLSYVAEAKPTGLHGDYTVISGTGAYANATGKGVFDSVSTKWTDGASLFDVTIDVHTPPLMGGGYTDVISIPVNDPAIKAISGALTEPAGAGPFPAVVYVSGCGGINDPADRAQQKVVINHLLSKGVATLIIDPFTPRNEPEGVCANLDEKRATQYFTRGGNDVLAALNVLEAMPDIDTKHIFLQGYSYGAISSLFAIDRKNPANHAKVGGIVAYYPYCYDGVDPSVPVLVMIGEKDDWTPAAKCQAVTGKADFEVVVYPGDTHAFTMNFGKSIDYLGHHMDYDEKATQDAQQRADAFMAAHMK